MTSNDTIPALVALDEDEDSVTRYLTATRVNPSDSDNRVFIDGCVALGAKYYGYSIVPMKTKVLFEGFIVLDHEVQEEAERLFPNFLLTHIRI
jgi:hypothetical protein